MEKYTLILQTTPEWLEKFGYSCESPVHAKKAIEDFYVKVARPQRQVWAKTSRIIYEDMKHCLYCLRIISEKKLPWAKITKESKPCPVVKMHSTFYDPSVT
jgi:hypothetical protein